MFIQAYLTTAINILDVYTGSEPLPSFLKKYFGAHKKFGSRDRKHIAHLCYCFFRLGKSLLAINKQERILIALFLCSKDDHPILKAVKPEWNDKVTQSLEEKITLLQPLYAFRIQDVLSLRDEVSDALDYDLFSASFFLQPNTFLRIRPGKKNTVQKKLNVAGIVFQMINESCLSVLPSTKVEEVLLINKEVAVQDLSSQQVLNPLVSFLQNEKKTLSVWDCCAASGGKSLLLKDIFPNSRLTVSDVRSSILVNLKKRFQQAGIQQYQSFVADMAAPNFSLPQTFDLIICDVPCSGSGTWSRTPEQLYFFQKNKIEYYSNLQRQIVTNAAKSLKPGGLLVYITCSVFKKENEEVVAYLQNKVPLQLQSSTYFKGYEQQADTLFSAVFTRL